MLADNNTPLAEGVAASPLTQKLARLMSLTSDEDAVLQELQTATRRIARGREVITEGRRYDGLLIVMSGVALRYRVLRDGRRQILNVALPGDFIGFPGCLFENALYSVGTLNDCVFAPISFARLFALLETHPRLGAAIFWSLCCETATYAEHLIDVGRRSALERVAHFLLEMLTRLQAVGLADQRSYRLPLTQELLADALGLSVQYVNQTLRQLREEGLVTIERQQVTIEDYDGLATLAEFERTYLNRFRIAELGAENWPGVANREKPGQP